MRQKIALLVPAYLPTRTHFGTILSRTIPSINNQTKPPDETIFCLNGFFQKDKTIFYDMLSKTCKTKYKILNLGQKASAAIALNKAYQATDPETTHICFLAADDSCDKTKIEKQSEAFLNDTNVDLIATHFNNVTRGKATPCERLGKYLTHYDIARTLPTENIVCGGSVMMKSNVYKKLGGFKVKQKPGEVWDEYDRPMWEDWDLWLRAIKNGYKFKTIDECLYNWHHDIGGHFRDKSKDR